MRRSILLSAAARRDIAAAKSWYADQGVPDLDLQFRTALELVFQQIERFPTGFPFVHRDIRRANLQRFPYAAFYHLRDEKLYLIAVVHHARHPQVWKHRR